MIDPVVQKMLDNEGIYVCSATPDPTDGDRIVIVSRGRVLRAMSVDQVLAPDRFIGTPLIYHGPLK